MSHNLRPRKENQASYFDVGGWYKKVGNMLVGTKPPTTSSSVPQGQPPQVNEAEGHVARQGRARGRGGAVAGGKALTKLASQHRTNSPSVSRERPKPPASKEAATSKLKRAENAGIMPRVGKQQAPLHQQTVATVPVVPDKQ